MRCQRATVAARWTHHAARLHRIRPRNDDGTTPRWQVTLWAMVGIQFIMTMSFSFLSPIMPLFLPELGVTTEAGIDLWSGILNGSTSFVAAFASPLWGRLADSYGRKPMLIRSSCAIAVFTA